MTDRLAAQNTKLTVGLQFQKEGRFDEAARCYQSVLAEQPDHADALHLLGVLHYQRGDVDQAIGLIERAAAGRPREAVFHANLALAYRARGELERCIDCCRTALRLRPDYPEAANNLGLALHDKGRFAEAVAQFDAALKMRPSSAAIETNRGMSLFELGRIGDALSAEEQYGAALAVWRKVVELTPDDAAAHSAMGWSLQQQGRFAEAGACYRRALELDPRLFNAVLNQGSLHEDLGELADAEATYRRARALWPDAPNPLARLAQLLRGKLPDADREAIEVYVAGHGPQPANTDPSAVPAVAPEPGVTALHPPTARPHGPLLFGLAQVLDARGEYARAADCLAEANALAREKRRSEGRDYDPASHSALVDLMIAGFTPRLFEHLSGMGDDTRMPVFVFGMPRSGTTLVEQILASHSRVHGAGELRLAGELFESIPQVLGRTDGMQSCLEALDAAGVGKLARRYMDGMNAALNRNQPTSDRETPPALIVDKMPDNYLYVGMLSVLFPRATLISVRRDMRDVALSCWMTNFRGIRWADDPENLAARCRDYRRLMGHWQAVLGQRMHEVAYERLVEAFDTEAPRLVAACGLDWEEACGRFHQTPRPVGTSSVVQVRQPLYRTSLHRWERYQGPLAGLFEKLNG